MKDSMKLALVGGLITLVAIAGTTAFVGPQEEKTLTGWDYQTCMLDDETGKKDSDDKSGISTKDFIKVDELVSVTLEDEDMEYYVNVYDADKAFLTVVKYTADMTDEDFAGIAEQGGEYVKFEIVDADTDEVGAFNRFSIAKGVEITIAEE